MFLAVGGLFCLYALGESLRFRMPKNAIGGGDAMTMIVLQNSSPVNSSEIFGGLAVICMVALVFLLRKRKNKERNIKK